MTASRPFHITVLLSGSGTTMVNLQQHIEGGKIPGKIVQVVSSRKNVLGVERAREYGIPVSILGRKKFTRNKQFDADAYAEALVELVSPYEPNLVVMAGFMTQLADPFLKKFQTINVHPALLPSFGGKGFYGHHVHEAVLAAGVKISGATVHFADGRYDRGPIICQEAVPVEESDTPDTLAARVQAAERRIYPKAVSLIAEGRVAIQGQRTVISDREA
ncbi:MAG: phosphoribosylglycinamide formyltransferase [Deltaproteobacteria bacterium]|nr:phosphoribosylglycinamide formyltransferase [Deltaproteobacteria bacterium]MBN2673362.1 phosphoribosylglycinamide formyltransferase [Deltaproteobacteria bacterium]